MKSPHVRLFYYRQFSLTLSLYNLFNYTKFLRSINIKILLQYIPNKLQRCLELLILRCPHLYNDINAKYRGEVMGKILELITKEMMVIFIAAMPLTELRGAIPIGISLGMNPIHATLLGIIGSLIPVPFLLIFIRPMFLYFRKLNFLRGFIDKTVQRTLKKSSKIKKYSAIGLVIFVALPLPTTGVWSGCLAAILFNIPFKFAFPAITIGTVLSGVIILCISYIFVVI